MSPTRDIDSLLEDVVTLPSLPTTVARITELLDRPDTPLSEVGKAISADPALALKTLRLVNSAYHGVREPVTSVDQAVVLLGTKVVRTLVLTASIIDSFENDVGGLLLHSVGCGIAMRSLVEGGYALDTPIANASDAFVMGLLHDIGKILLQQFLPEEYTRAAELSRSRGLRQVDAERSIIGSDHADMGARLAKHWWLGETLYEPIAGHHELDACSESYRKSAALLAIADYTVYAAGYLPVTNAPFPMLDPAVWDVTELSGKDLTEFIETFVQNAAQIDELIDVAK